MRHVSITIPFGKREARLILTVPSGKKLPYGEDLPQGQKFPLILICPGGGYSVCSWREAEPIALTFLAKGFATAQLFYSVGKNARYPQCTAELALAVAYLKEHAEEYSLDPERIILIGFSAGAHLALTLGVNWHRPWLSKLVGKASETLRPFAQVLCYPVVCCRPELWHKGSFQQLLGEALPEERFDEVSLEKWVDEKTPQTFLWTTDTDNDVPSENSLVLALALKRAGVPTEYHQYGWGPHGLSLANEVTKSPTATGDHQIQPHAASWVALCEEWLRHILTPEA